MQGAVVDRKDWVDIYKAIAIILVVIGHATGQFNTYIYISFMLRHFFSYQDGLQNTIKKI